MVVFLVCRKVADQVTGKDENTQDTEDLGLCNYKEEGKHTDQSVVIPRSILEREESMAEVVVAVHFVV